MKLGIDFGATRIVAAAVDKGNYPVVSFETPDGGSADWFPPLVAIRGTERNYGWDAYERQADPQWTVLGSLKRLLEDAGPNMPVECGGAVVPLIELLAELTGALRVHLLERSSLPLSGKGPLEAMLGVPANANTNQRFLTAEAFRLGGFHVAGMLNEPSAASIEYGHRHRSHAKDKQLLLVYDLGGGTFDASLVEHDEVTHTVIATEGISNLGGGDFDLLLGQEALAEAGVSLEALSQGERFRLLEECRQRKESLHPNTRKIIVDLSHAREGLPEIALPVSRFYERVRPLAERTLDAVRALLDGQNTPSADTLYLSGGGSELPLILRLLREEFGRRVKRSAYTRSATAIGLAIQSDAAAGYKLRDRFTRYFGVWREADLGERIVFDTLFEKGTPLPSEGEPPITITRRYRPVHNIGHFRYLESSHIGAGSQPAGDITLWDEILFPLDPQLRNVALLPGMAVSRSAEPASQRIEEVYRCHAGGCVEVTIRNLDAGYERSYPLGRWAVKTKGQKRRPAMIA
jgi:molecular chaperone DnaK (HSP70)